MIRRPPATHPAGLFTDSEPETKSRPAAYQLNIDGGSRGNPGPASYGVVVRNERGEIVAKLKKYIGRTTNNVAEYYGLIAALDYAQSNGVACVADGKRFGTAGAADARALQGQERGLAAVV